MQITRHFLNSFTRSGQTLTFLTKYALKIQSYTRNDSISVRCSFYSAETRIILMDIEKGNLEGANKRLFNMLEHAPDEDLFRLATSVNGDMSKMFHDVGNVSN